MKRIALSVLLFFLFCTVEMPAQICDVAKEKIYTAVEHMPQFPGGDSNLMRYISDNLRYPDAEINVGTQAIVQFVVTKTGEVGDVKIVRRTGEKELDDEAVRVVKSLPKFIPGRNNGEPVNVWYTLPIRFKQRHATAEPMGKVYEVKMPQFPGGEKALMEYISDNLNYSGYEISDGKVSIKFIVTETGNIENITVMGDVEEMIANDLSMAIKTLPRFTPGSIDGRPVNMWYETPPINLIIKKD